MDEADELLERWRQERLIAEIERYIKNPGSRHLIRGSLCAQWAAYVAVLQSSGHSREDAQAAVARQGFNPQNAAKVVSAIYGSETHEGDQPSA